MRNPFPIFQSHLDLAHAYWKQLVRPGDTVVDATCGNGHDSLVLAQLSERLYAMDIQPSAIAATKERLSSFPQVKILLQSHTAFPEELRPESVTLLVYNLGYLPGGDKTLTTRSSTTLMSLIKALELIRPGGAISLTLYPGHLEGEEEERAILDWAAQLDPKQWSSCHHRWCNRKAAPSLLILQKAMALGVR